MSTELTFDLDQVAAALAASASFKTWCGNPATIADHICFSDANKVQHLPCVVLSLGPGWIRSRVCVSGSDPFATEPEVEAEFFAALTSGAASSTAVYEMYEDVSGIMRDLEAGGYQIENWGPKDESTPAVTSHSATTDYISFTVSIKGGFRNSADEGT